jgi:MoaA/NifB/PqqE/SkfB family radical SAM enzyme
LWRSSVINWDGGAAPCCYLTDKTDDFGDVSDTPFSTIWNNPSYRAARELFKKGPAPEQTVGCLTCPVYTGSEAGQLRGHDVHSAKGEVVPVELPFVNGRNGHSNGGQQSTGHDEEAVVTPSKTP